MDHARLARARRALTDPRVRDFDEEATERLARALDDPSHADELVAVGRHGALAFFLPDPLRGVRRRILELDRTGGVVAALRWNGTGALESAAVRTGLGAWIGVEPGRAQHAMWGPSDRLWRLGAGPRWQPLEPLTVFESVEWSAITHVPALAEPARLPHGAGTAILNLVAALAKDQGTPRLRYGGPFATEGLFTALLESFRFDAGGDDPLREFLDGRLAWVPAPHERHFPAPGLCVQLRERLEKVVLDGRTYYRHDWQSVRRHASRRVHDVGDRVHCSLWALGTAIEDHAILSRSGEMLAHMPSATETRPAAAIPAAVRDGVAALICATSAAALGAEIRRLVTAMTLRWAPLSGDLAAVDGDGIRFSWRLAEAAAMQVRAATSRGEWLARGLELVVEMAALAGDAVRARAQAALAAATPEAQEAALSTAEQPDAGAIARAAEAVIATLDAERDDRRVP